MTEKKQENLRERMERIWRRRRPDLDDQTELTAEGQETRTPEREEFFGNLEKAALDEPPAETLPHPRRDQNGE